MSDNIIHVENLVKKYGDLAAVNDISFAVSTTSFDEAPTITRS